MKPYKLDSISDEEKERQKKAKADYLARLEESRKWLKEYVRPTING
jgi:hypothetical protein